MLGVKISLCPPQAKKILLSGSKIVMFVQFGASESGVGSRNQVLALSNTSQRQVLVYGMAWHGL